MALISLTRKAYLELKDRIFALDRGLCHICGKCVFYKDAVLDHIIPSAISGRGDLESPDEYWNLRLAHRKCNWRRSNAKIAGQLRLNIIGGLDATSQGKGSQVKDRED